jgi:Flp pilus assembly secretin CpaC
MQVQEVEVELQVQEVLIRHQLFQEQEMVEQVLQIVFQIVTSNLCRRWWWWSTRYYAEQVLMEQEVQAVVEQVMQVDHQEQVQLTLEVVEVEEVLAPLGGAGGSGIVIVRAPGTANISASPGTNTVTTLPAPAGGCKVATFTVSGDITIG